MTIPPESTASGTSSAGQTGSAPVDPTAIQATAPPVTTAIQTESPPAVTDRISLPPLTPEQLEAEDAVRKERMEFRLDFALAFLVLALAFLSAFFPIHNSDFLMHLGVGKLLSEGKYTFGADPFSVNSLDARWVNHAWLYDLFSYWAYRVVGGQGLSILKALLVTALAGVMLMIRRPGQSLWIPSLCTALAILAMSPRLLMQPTLWSFLFLALTLWVLTLRGEKSQGRLIDKQASWLTRFANWPYRLYMLPVLFVIWVNIDSWFVLGPITVALYWLGEATQEALAPIASGPDAPSPGDRKQLLIVLGLGVAACLLNPYHIHAFAIPGELSPAIAEEIKNDPAYRRMFWSPLSNDFWSRVELRRNAAELAYYPLLILGFASFVVNLSGWRWWRVLMWSAFAVFGAYHARSIPFFAVVAGPIMALNLQDAIARRFSARREKRYVPSIWSLAGRALSVLLLLAAVGAAVPGWLHGFTGDNSAEWRRVGWGLDTDPALVATCEQLAQWRREGKITDEQNAFNFHPDVANYLALYCPEEKSFFDYRFPLFKTGASTYLRLRGDFRRGGSSAEWQKTFRERHIKHAIVYYDQDAARVLPALDRLEEDRYLPEKLRQWTLIELHGRVALYAWSDPELGWDEERKNRTRESEVRAMELQPDQRAFGPDAETAPGKRHSEGPQGRDSFWTQYSVAVGSRAADSHEALYHWYISNLETQQAGRAAGTDYAKLIASAVAYGNVPQNTPERLYFALAPYRSVLVGPPMKFRSPASTLLAIRAARRALAANPEDDIAYKFLALSYQILPENIGDLFTSQTLITEMRKCQIAGALYTANKLNPDRVEVHEQLYKFYFAQNFLDLGVQHMKRFATLTEEAGIRPGERAEDYRDRLRELREKAKDADEKIKQIQNKFLIESKLFTNVLSKVQQAQKYGLTGEALDLLLKAKPEELGAAGEAMELHFLLRVGRVEEWPETLREPGNDNTLAWLLVMRAATVGDYDQADELLAKMIPNSRERYLASLPTTVAVQAAPVFLDMPDGLGMKPIGLGIAQRLLGMQRTQPLKSFTPTPPEEGELSVIRGILALECGKNEHALSQFRHALNVSFPPARYVPYFSVLGTNFPFATAATILASSQLAIGPQLSVPSLRWALDYGRLLEQNAKP
jgi:hypothetical protein